MEDSKINTLGTLVISLLSRGEILSELEEGTVSAILKALDPITVSNKAFFKALDTLKTTNEMKRDPEVFKYFNNQIENDFNTNLDKAISGYNFDQATIHQITSQPSLAQKAAKLAEIVKKNAAPSFANLEKKLDDVLSGKKVNSAVMDSMQKNIDDAEVAFRVDPLATKLEEEFFGYK